MSKAQKAKLRSLPTVEVAKRYHKAIERCNITAKWRYFFELSLRALEAQIEVNP